MLLHSVIMLLGSNDQEQNLKYYLKFPLALKLIRLKINAEYWCHKRQILSADFREKSNQLDKT